jgi:hypothetical protein
VHTFHKSINGEDFEPVPFRLDHGGVVADAHGEPGRRHGEESLDASNQLALGEI